MQLRRYLDALVCTALLAGCSGGKRDAAPAQPMTGPWHLALHLDGRDLPFLFDLDRSSTGQWTMVIHNAEEAIIVNEVETRNDSFFVRMPLFDSEFRGVLRSPGHISGQWTNYLKGPDYHIPFDAHAGPRPRFAGSTPPNVDLSGPWETRFAPGTDREFPALGQIEQEPSGRITGTFMTETGDYRYLEGVVHGDSMHLSGFDGTFALLFAARLQNDTIRGRFWSGTHWQSDWSAHRNPYFMLRDPDSLTHLREGYDMVDFQFPDLEGNPVTPQDARFKDKVLVVQIMGSWCPNCVDETRLLNDLYATYNHQGLEILSIAFEKHPNVDRSIAALERFRNALDVRYPILYAGMAGGGQAAEKLPFLEHVMSFPTCILIDRAGIVRRIRTGIYGPGTGEHYANYKRSLELFISTLLAEPVTSELAGR